MGVFGWDSHCLMFSPIPGQKGSWQSIFRNFVQLILKCHHQQEWQRAAQCCQQQYWQKCVGTTFLTFPANLSWISGSFPHFVPKPLCQDHCCTSLCCSGQFHYFTAHEIFYISFYHLIFYISQHLIQPLHRATMWAATTILCDPQVEKKHFECSFLKQQISFPLPQIHFYHSVEISPGMLHLRLPRYWRTFIGAWDRSPKICFCRSVFCSTVL